MLTGKSMFRGGNRFRYAMAAVLRADIGLGPFARRHVPGPVRRLLQRCLERDPKRRLRDIGDAWIEIDSPAVAAVAAPARANSWLLLDHWQRVVLGGAGIAWGIWQSMFRHCPAGSEFTPILADKAILVLPAISPMMALQAVLTAAHGASLNLMARMLDEESDETHFR